MLIMFTLTELQVFVFWLVREHGDEDAALDLFNEAFRKAKTSGALNKTGIECDAGSLTYVLEAHKLGVFG